MSYPAKALNAVFNLSAAVAIATVAACANQAAPPGGPPDTASPLILSITPEDHSVGGIPKSVVIRFDEVISETPKSSKNLSDLVFISPKSGDTRVSWGRTRITIRPAKGFKPNTVYSIQIKPGIQDLRNNGIDSVMRIVFSTGGPIPDTRITGVAFDWAAGKGISNAVVEAVSKDSTVYQAVSDSVGRFEMRYLPDGPYLLRAFADRNSNREPDPLEAWDSTSVTLTQSSNVEFYAFVHDTVGLRVTKVEVLDTNRVLKVEFDKPYPSDQQFTPQMIVVTRADSTRVPVRLVQTAAQKAAADSAVQKARADSIAKAAEAKLDTSLAARTRRDSLARVQRQDSIAAAQRAERERQRVAAQAARARGQRLAPIDTTPPPKMNRPPVYSEIFITLDSALAWQSQFRLQVDSVKSLSGTVKSPSRNFATPRAPKIDSTPAAKDTTARGKDSRNE